MSFFDKLKKGLNKTKENISGNLNRVFAEFRKVDEDLLNELEEALILADISYTTSSNIINRLRENIKLKNIKDADEVKIELKNILLDILSEDFEEVSFNKEDGLWKVILVVGVNGVGKTTSIGKIANLYKKQGNKVLIVAGDTYRAAAVEQLEIWANRSNSDLLKGRDKEDPASIAYKATEKAINEGYNILICDTAGRIHNKKNLMEELAKIDRSINKALANIKVDKETLLVIDGTVGQNAIMQTKAFMEVTDITGLVVTKLDGSSKGGAVISIKEETGLPIRYVGVGEQIDDLQAFNPEDFIDAIIS